MIHFKPFRLPFVEISIKRCVDGGFKSLPFVFVFPCVEGTLVATENSLFFVVMLFSLFTTSVSIKRGFVVASLVLPYV